jgi:hypothetical protein
MDFNDLNNNLKEFIARRDDFNINYHKDMRCVDLVSYLGLGNTDSMKEVAKVIDFIIDYYKAVFNNQYPSANEESIQWFLKALYEHQKIKAFIPLCFNNEDYMKHIRKFNYYNIISDKLKSYKYQHELCLLMDIISINFISKLNVYIDNMNLPSFTFDRIKYGFIRLDNEAYKLYKNSESEFPYNPKKYFEDNNTTLNTI